MGKLHNLFLETIKSLGISESMHPLFYNAPIGIRFEIGGDEEIYLKRRKVNPVYIEEAFKRANAIYQNLPEFDLLRIDIYPDERNYQQRPLNLKDFTNIGLPLPKEKKIENIIIDDEEHQELYLYWDLSSQEIEIGKLLIEIIKADIGGFNELASAVYFVNTKEKILYHLYDDRGLDVVAKTVKILRSTYYEYNSWILDYDKDEIDKNFKESDLSSN